MGSLGVWAIIQFLETHCSSLLMLVGEHLEPQVNAYEGSMKMKRSISGVGTGKRKPDGIPFWDSWYVHAPVTSPICS